jgi:hypothetical protein
LVSYGSSFRTIAESVPIYQISGRRIKGKARNSLSYLRACHRR